MDRALLSLGVDTTDVKKGVGSFKDLAQASDAAGRSGKQSGGLINKSMREAAGGIDTATKSGTGLTSGLGKIKTLIAGVGFLSLAKNAIAMGNSFDSSMNTVQAKLLATSTEMKGLREQAKQLGSETAFSASQAADGMGYLAQAGLGVSEIMQAMPHTLNLASAAGMDLARSADIATNVMGAFRLKVSDLPAITDMLALTSARANTSVEEMAEAIKQVGPVAAGFGVDMYEAGAAIGQLSNNGIKGSQAGMVLKNMLAQLASPVGQAKKALDSLNLSTTDFYDVAADGSLKFKGFSSALKTIESAGGNATEMIKIFGREAGPGGLALQGSVELIDDLEASIRKSGAASEMAAIQMQGMPGVIKSAASAWEALNIAFVELGGARIVITVLTAATEVMRYLATDGADFLKTKLEALEQAIGVAAQQYEKFVEAFRTSDALPFELLRNFAQIVSNIGDALSPVIDYVDDFVFAIAGLLAAKATIAALGIAFGVLTGAVALLTSPIALLGAFVAAIKAVYDNWEDLVRYWNSATLNEHVANIETKAIDLAQKASDLFVKFWNNFTLIGWVLPITSDPIQVAKDLADDFVKWWSSTTLDEKILDIITAPIDLASGLFETFITSWNSSRLKALVTEVDSTALTDGIDKFDDLMATVDRTYDAIQPTLKAFFDPLEDAVKILTVDVVNALDHAFDDVLDIFNELEKTITFIWNALWPKLGPIVKEAWDYIQRITSVAYDALKLVIESAWAAITGVVKTALQFMRGDFEAGWNTLRQTADTLIENFVKMFTDIVPRMTAIGGDILDGLTGGIKSGLTSVSNAATEMGSSFVDTVRGVFDSHSPSRIMIAIGHDVTDGLAIGVDEGGNTVVAAAEKVSNNAVSAFDRMVDGLELQYIKLTEGEEAAKRYQLGMQGIEGANQNAIISAQNHIEALKAQDAAIEEFRGTIRGLFDAVLDGENPLKEMEKIAKDWLRDMIAHFATNQIMATMGLNTSGLGSLAGGPGGLLNMIGGASGTTGSVGSLLGNSSMGGLEIAGVSAGAAGAALGAGGIGYAVGDALGAGSPEAMGALSAVGMAVGGPLGAALGAALGSAFGGKKEAVRQGVEVGYSGGAATGQNFTDFEKRKSLWRGTKRWTEYEELDSGVAEAVDGYFANMNSTIVAQAEALGIAGADDILQGFEVATQRFTGENAEEELQQWLSESTRAAYQDAYQDLGPELQALVSDSVDMVNGPVEEIGELFQNLGVIAQAVVPVFDAMGLSLGDNLQVSAANGYLLTEAMGGMQPAMQQLSMFANEFAPAGYAASQALENTTSSIYDWNQSIGRGGDSVLSHMNALADYTSGIDQSTEAGRIAAAQVEAFTQSMDGSNVATVANVAALDAYISGIDTSTAAGQMAYDSAMALAESLQQTGTIAGVSKDSFDTFSAAITAASASGEISADVLHWLAGGYDEASDRIAINRDILDSYGAALDLSTESGRAAAEAVSALQQELDGQQTSMIANQTGLSAYVASLDTSTEAGRRAMEQVQAFTTGLDGASGSVEINRAGLDAYISSLDTSTESGRVAYDAAMALSEAVGVSGQSAITSREQLYEYVSSLDLTTEAGRNAAAAAFAQMEAIMAYEDEMNRQKLMLDTVSEAARNLNLNFDAASPLALGASDALIQLMGGLEQFTGATATYFDTFYSQQEQQDLALAQSAAAVMAFNETLGLTGEAALDSKEEFRAYVESLDLTTEAGRNAFAAAMEVAEAMGVVVEQGSSLEEVIASLPENLQGSFGLMNDALNETSEVATDTTEALRIQFEALSAQLGLTGESAITTQAQFAEYIGSLDLTTAAGQQAYQTALLTAEGLDLVNTSLDTSGATAALSNEQIAALNEQLGLTGAAAITTNQEFQDYIASLDLTTEAGRQAMQEALELSGALDGVTEAGTAATAELSAAAGSSAEAATAAEQLEAAALALDEQFLASTDSLGAAADVSGEVLGALSDTITQSAEMTKINAEEIAVANEGINVSLQTAATGFVEASADIETTSTQMEATFEELATRVDDSAIAIAAASEVAGTNFTGLTETMLTTAVEVTNSSNLMGENIDNLSATLTASSDLTLAANDAMMESFEAFHQTIDEKSIALDDTSFFLGNVLDELGASMQSNAVMIAEATAYANGALAGFSGAIHATASAADSAADVAAGAAYNAANSADAAASSAGSASNQASRAADAATSAASAAWRVVQSAESTSTSTGSYSDGLWRVSQDARMVTVHRDEAILNKSDADAWRRDQIDGDNNVQSIGGGGESRTAQEVRRLSAELIKSREESKQLAQMTNNILSYMAANSDRQVEELDGLNRSSDRLARQGYDDDI